MVEDLEEIISEYLRYLRPLKRIVLLLSPIALFFGFSEFSIYSTFIVKDPFFIVKDFSYLFKTFLFYYIFALTLFLIIFIVFLLVTPLYFKTIEENNSEEGNRLSQIFKKFIKKPYFLFIYFIALSALFVLYIVQGGFFILPLIGINMPFWFNALSFLGFVIFLHFLMQDLLKRIIEARGRDKIKAIFSFITQVFITMVIIYASILIVIPFQLSKLGYFKANLVLEKEYVNKPEFQDYLKMCHQNTQNNNYYIPSFIFLRTSSEYIVGCSKDSNVRIHIPADKVIAIEYIEEENKNTPATQQQNKQTEINYLQLICNYFKRFYFYLQTLLTSL
jgi:hypothetical protein